jgi:hypothetical protein
VDPSTSRKDASLPSAVGGIGPARPPHAKKLAARLTKALNRTTHRMAAREEILNVVARVSMFFRQLVRQFQSD